MSLTSRVEICLSSRPTRQPDPSSLLGAWVSAVYARTLPGACRVGTLGPGFAKRKCTPSKASAESDNARATLGLSASAHSLAHRIGWFQAARSTVDDPCSLVAKPTSADTPCVAGWNTPFAPWTHRALRQRPPDRTSCAEAQRARTALATPTAASAGSVGFPGPNYRAPPSTGDLSIQSRGKTKL